MCGEASQEGSLTVKQRSTSKNHTQCNTPRCPVPFGKYFPVGKTFSRDDTFIADVCPYGSMT